MHDAMHDGNINFDDTSVLTIVALIADGDVVVREKITNRFMSMRRMVMIWRTCIGMQM